MNQSAQTSYAPAGARRRGGRAGQPWLCEELPQLTAQALHAAVLDDARAGGRFAGVWAHSAPGAVDLVAVTAFDGDGRLSVRRASVGPDESFPSLTVQLPAAHAFERAIFETTGLRPLGHPWLKPLLRHADLEGGGAGSGGREYPFFRVDGPGIHEVAVGPVHAGIIEPGHFRFQCAGEEVLHVEIQLGYQHRGVEARLCEAPAARRLCVAESIAGDTVIGHATAHCQAIEALARTEVPPRAQALRALALELERIANHVGDLGALCGDVGYVPGAAYLGRLRGDFLNLLAEICGNRFGRGLLVYGGVRFNIDERQRAALAQRLVAAQRDVDDVTELVLAEPSVLSRFEQTGTLEHDTAHQLGMVGPAARASGCRRDVRVDHPSGFFRFAHIPLAAVQGGDVFARALVRQVETRRSLAFVHEALDRLPAGPLAVPLGTPAAHAAVVEMVEGWRGEIVHVAFTDAAGRLSDYHIADPSLHNWFGLAMAMRNQQISDFPLVNKSFNLSYAGHDR